MKMKRGDLVEVLYKLPELPEDLKSKGYENPPNISLFKGIVTELKNNQREVTIVASFKGSQAKHTYDLDKRKDVMIVKIQ